MFPQQNQAALRKPRAPDWSRVYLQSSGAGVPQADAGRLPGTRLAGGGGTDELRPSACSAYLLSVIGGPCPNHIVSVHL